MSDPVTGVSSFITSINFINQSQKQIELLSSQNSTGNRSVSLAGYGTDAARILNLNSSIAETQTYIGSSQQVGTFLSAYNTGLTQLQTDATSLKNALTSLSTDASAGGVASLQTLIQGLESDVGATLNTQTGERYLFAGSRYDTAPVADLTSASLTPSTPAAFTAATAASSTIPNYDTAYVSPGTVSSSTPYYTQQTVNIASNTTVTYGSTSNDPSIQALVYALKNAQAAVNAGTTTATGQQFLADAQSAATLALTGGTDSAGTTVSGLGAMLQQNSTLQAQVTSTTTAQTTAVSTLQTQLGDLTQVNAATVATELSAVENQLEGTYKATSTLLSLSILKYLS